MLTTGEAAAYLGVGVRNLAANWQCWGLRPYKIGKRNMYRVGDLERWLSAQRHPAARRTA